MTYSANRRQVLAGLGAAAATLAVSPRAALAQTTSLRVGTSSVGSVFYTLAIGAGEMIREQTGINTTVEPVGGSAANVNGIGRGNVDLAIANSFATFSGYTGTGAFDERVDVRLVLQGQPSFRWILVRRGAGIESAADLEGRTIIGERRSLPELRLVLDALAQAEGLDTSTMNIVATSNSGESMDAIAAGSVDAIVMPFSPRAGMIEEAMRGEDVDLLYVSEQTRDAMLEHLPPAFYGAEADAEMFSNQGGVAPLVSLNTYMIARPDLEEDAVYQVARAILENLDTFGTYHATGRLWTVENLLGSPAVPYHPGVIRYLREIDAWGEAQDALQEDLLAM